MPVKACNSDGKPGFKWGEQGACYTYTPGDETGKRRAQLKARMQGQAIAFSRARQAGRDKPTAEDFD